LFSLSFISEIHLGGLEKLGRFTFALRDKKQNVGNGIDGGRIWVIAAYPSISADDLLASPFAFLKCRH